jgi:phosphate/sulfate permease
VVGGIFISWVVTLPIAAALSAIVFTILRAIFG